ncbi:hypothetical protein MQM1_080 [Aeromonas phage vB_AsaP_MQM1]|nr:hypothetical protein MQM1_080 [Aeromonas phage vB_AsaP_MQM1]
MVVGKLLKLVFDGDTNVLPYNYVVKARELESRTIDEPFIIAANETELADKINAQAHHYLKCRNYNFIDFKVVASYESISDSGEFWPPSQRSCALSCGL